MKKRKKQSNSKSAEIEHLSFALQLNGQAISEGPKSKKWSVYDLKEISPLTSNQNKVFESWNNGDHVCAHGSAGSGKTFLALYLALFEVLQKQQQRIIIVRSIVPTREVGFLPGTLDEKMDVYQQPYVDILQELMGRSSTYNDMKDAKIIEFISTSFIRGITFDNSIIIVDEANNMTSHEIDTVMTRVGENSRVFLCGDVVQTDLNGRNGNIEGLTRAISIFGKMKDFSIVEFDQNDIVRSGFVKEWIISSQNTEM